MSDVIPIDSDVRSGYISVVLAGQNELERMIRSQLVLKDYMGLSRSSLGSIKTTSATFKPKDGESFQAFRVRVSAEAESYVALLPCAPPWVTQKPATPLSLQIFYLLQQTCSTHAGCLHFEGCDTTLLAAVRRALMLYF